MDGQADGETDKNVWYDSGALTKKENVQEQCGNCPN